ncbi:MAG TPA: hypothetical protein PL074_00265 [Thermoflexales bacterium]|nr:hypothetical protein [Thermoflexales bacterium]HQX74710.1 hypothetical protein [Thermoflexales bacterium]
MSDRADIRNAVFEGLSAALSLEVNTAGAVANGYVRKVYNGLPYDFGGLDAVIAVFSGNTRRPSAAMSVFRGSSADHRLSVGIYTRYGVEGDETWTPAIAEGMADACEERVAAWVAANATRDGVWKRLAYANDGTPPTSILLNGVEYRKEVITLEASVY